jgi:hypothetical protein
MAMDVGAVLFKGARDRVLECKEPKTRKTETINNGRFKTSVRRDLT